MKYEYPSGSYYESDIVDETFEGTDHFYFANGDVYHGKFENNI